MNRLIEVAIDSPRNRGRLIAKNKLVELITEDRQLFRSIYLYGNDAMEYVSRTGSLKGFSGMRDIDNVVLDIDKGTNSSELTHEKAQEAVLQLDANGLDKDTGLLPFFSGTGYHIVIPNAAFGFKEGNELHMHVKETVKKMFPNNEIDTSIFMRTGIYRVAHTLNSKSGLYKIPLTVEELWGHEASDIMMMAKEQRLDFSYRKLENKLELKNFVVKTLPRAELMASAASPHQIVPCVQEMLTMGPIESSRHHTAMRIISHFRRHGIPTEYAGMMTLYWNNNSLPEDEIIRLVDDVYNGAYKYSCGDVVMKEHCKTNCVYFKRKDYLIDVKSVDELQESLRARLTTDFRGKTVNIARMLGLTDMDTRIYPGELVTIFGPTGSSKTALAQNIALGIDFQNDCVLPDCQIPTLFLSLELADWVMHRRNLQIISGEDKETVEDNYEELYEEHRELLSHLVVQMVPPTIAQIQEKIRELQPAMVIVDYIDLVDTPPNIRGEYEQVKYISHSLSSMAVNNDVIIIQVSQVSRDYSRNEILDLYAGKGSGAIENASRKVIGLNGQANSNAKHLEMYKNTDGELFEVDLEWRPSFRLRRI